MFRKIFRFRSRPSAGKASAPARTARLRAVEHLEARAMLHGGELAWDFSRGLTLSFVPDGTEVAGHKSELFSNLPSEVDAANLQATVLRAFRTWADYTNIRLSVVDDGGQALGIGGAGQSDPRFGDVRLAAVPMTAEVYAISVPHNQLVSGTWAGDILFNSDLLQELTLDELHLVVLHEAGHVLGLEHSDDPESPMFAHGINTSLQPTPDDIDDIQEMYGVRGESQVRFDECEEEDDGDEVANRLPPSTGFADAFRFDASGRIAPAGERDEFLIGGKADEGEMDVLTVAVWASEEDQLMPLVEIRDDRGRRMDVEVLRNHAGQFIVQTRNADPRETYRLIVHSAADDPQFETGAYTLSATFSEARSRREFFAEATLDREREYQDRSLYVAQTQLFHLALQVDDVERSQGVVAWTVVYDGQGQPVTGIAARPGETRTTDSVLLLPGEYLVRSQIGREGEDSSLPSVELKIEGFGFSIPIGPPKVDPTTMPIYSCTTVPDLFCYPGAPPVPQPYHWPLTPFPGLPPIAVPQHGAVTPLGVPGLWYWKQSMFAPMSASSTPGTGSASNATEGGDTAASSDAPLSWNNPDQPADTNGDGVVAPLDALLVINFLNAHGSGPLRSRQATDPRINCKDDGLGTPLDVLAIINVLNT